MFLKSVFILIVGGGLVSAQSLAVQPVKNPPSKSAAIISQKINEPQPLDNSEDEKITTLQNDLSKIKNMLNEMDEILNLGQIIWQPIDYLEYKNLKKTYEDFSSAFNSELNGLLEKIKEAEINKTNTEKELNIALAKSLDAQKKDGVASTSLETARIAKDRALKNFQEMEKEKETTSKNLKETGEIFRKVSDKHSEVIRQIDIFKKNIQDLKTNPGKMEELKNLKGKLVVLREELNS